MATPNVTTPQKATPKRKGLKFGVQTEFTCMASVIPGHERVIRETINRAANDPRRESVLKQIPILHQARFVLFDDDTRLLFASSFDGTWDKYIDDAAPTYIGEMFQAIWSHCEGFPGVTDPNVKDWFMDHTYEAVFFSNAYPAAAVKEIQKALELQRTFQQVLDDPAAEQALSAPVLQPLLAHAAT